MNNLKVYAIAITIILILGLGYIGYNYFGNRLANTFYSQGYNQATIDIISNIQSTGNIPMLSNETGEITVEQISINTICGGKINE